MELVADKRTRQPFDASVGVGTVCTARAYDAGLITRALTNDVIPLCPPLIITADQVDELFGKLETALDGTLEQVSGHMGG